MNDDVLLDLDGPVANLTLNRPQRGNAIDLPMAQALLRAAIRCDQDPAIRCVVITGAGRLFCAGGDLGAFTASGDEVPGFLSELAGVLHLAISRLMRMAKPLVVLVNGPAAGAGMSLSLLGDIVLASGSAHFTPAYSGIGLSPDGGLSWHLPRLVGLRRAQEILLLNRRLDAAQAPGPGPDHPPGRRRSIAARGAPDCPGFGRRGHAGPGPGAPTVVAQLWRAA
ncbi:MAG: enoyl-CoA hydratase/isomerase family protein [Candidatus Pseudomonas colombiensis]|nr:MAG: enoyl-CoA hydratase/isomerase family protein [Pseudomonas sp.]